MHWLDRFISEALNPETKISPFKELALVNAALGFLVLIFNAGTPAIMQDDFGVPRYWFVVLCFVAVLLPLYRATPGVFLLMVTPIAVYAGGQVYTATKNNDWSIVLIPGYCVYLLIRLYNRQQDRRNGLH